MVCVYVRVYVCVHARTPHACKEYNDATVITVDKPNSCDRESMYTWHTDKQVGT